MTKRRFKNAKPVGANSSLGNSLVKNIEEKRKTYVRSRKDSDGAQFQNLNEEKEEKNVDSKTHENSLDEFMASANLAGREFAADRSQVKILSLAETSVVVMNKRFTVTEAQRKELESNLPIPRRPYKVKWESKDELIKAENQAFLDWRRKLADIQENTTVMLTPFERNLELWRQLWRVVERSDVIVQIVDARNPLLFRSVDLEGYVKEVDPRKRNVLLINKADLLTREQILEWKNYFKSNNISAVFWSALSASKKNEKDINDLNVDELLAALPETDEESDGTLNDEEPTTSEQPEVTQPERDENVEEEEYGLLYMTDGNKLMDFLKGHINPDFGDHHATIGMVGYPNVGKSSTINSILGSKKVSVSATPGKTKHFQTFILDEKLTLCDCPGLTMPSYALNAAEMLINGILPANQMKDHFEAGALIAVRVPRRVFEVTYSIILPKPVDFESDIGYTNGMDLLTTVAFAKGYMSTSGVPDYSRAARLIVRNVVDGVIKWVKAPPGIEQKTFDEWTYKKTLMKKNKGNMFVLNQISKRNLLEGDKGKLNTLDSNFFNSEISTIHTKGKFMPKKGNDGKISLKKPKKIKLRNKFSHLDV
uniref:Large subunit GTPase 1 homolog n=1 Tax=Strongyloides venezuelensis TaxID=75913 RepID=A0A0K0G0B0_STRVS